MNPNLGRWLKSSIAKYLKDVATVPAIVEGLDDRSPAFMEAPDRIEIRVNGPFTKELSAGYFRVTADVNVLVNSAMANKNAYTLDNILGTLHGAMDSAIGVFRFGDGPDDDQTLIGCLTPQSPIRTIHFGEITPGLKQGEVDARYTMDVS